MDKVFNAGFGSILEEAMDVTPDCFGIFNQEGIVVYSNHVFAQIFANTKETIVGQENSELLRRMWASKQGIVIETDDFNQWYQNLEKIHEEKTLNQFETDLTDGRWFKMTRVTLNSGYILLFGVDITELKQIQKSLEVANQKIEALANTDQLTGLNNRRAFQFIADQEFKKSQRYQHPLSLLLIDIDRFKLVNDNNGHEGGDDVLREFACVCQKLLRGADFLCRFGGEEFVVLLPMTEEDGAYHLAEKICTHVATHDFYLDNAGCYIKISVSIGVSSLTRTDKSIKKILNKADKALYTAKQNGRNQVVVW